ncbi:MAG: porphobilinogen deaminase [Chloroflexus sp.]|uniref:hydroxymethylbilane synthase n=1 Tax=Chloroflexus sp. TaxID=1904827 RepID=UPI0021DBA51D|nr:hydroxymethylbilane synthase [Chloroflexus sp.]GIV90484.1 MAG: porphobilinogen deaminase [Chloroflexus sp.]
MARLLLGTRGSALARTQSEWVANVLRNTFADLSVELRIITTTGDRVLDVALSAVGDKGLFVKELEQALLAGDVDLCVHSAKDMPTATPPGLMLSAFPVREDPRDVLVVRHADVGTDLATLPTGARIGTSSLRRASQLRYHRPDLHLNDVRGNVDTRLRKLASGQYDALILAAAGLRRLGLWDGTPGASIGEALVYPLDPSVMLPAVAQGILAVETRTDDETTNRFVAALDDSAARTAALAERAFLRRLEGGCQIPVAAHAVLTEAGLHFRGMVGALDGSTLVFAEQVGDPAQPEAVGIAVAEAVLAQGGEAILAAIRSQQEAQR